MPRPNHELPCDSGGGNRFAPVVIVMGVCGCGKNVVGERLAAAAGGTFFDADDYHATEMVAKMARGEPLTDEDRWPWLQRLHEEIIAPAIVEREENAGSPPAIVGCSALRRVYREKLRGETPSGWVCFVHLKGSEELITRRMEQRQGHYMKQGMVASQFAILEPPQQDECALEIGIERSPDEIAQEVLSEIRLLWTQSARA